MRINSLHKPIETVPTPPVVATAADAPVVHPLWSKARVPLAIVATAALIYLLQQMQSVLVPFVLGLLLFYALDPIVDWMQQWWVPRALGAALAITLAIGSVGAVAYLLQGQA